MINIKQGVEAQKKYCEENKVPMFAPPNGYCWSCRTNIYTIISVKEASARLITGCPHCNKSYVD